jgi:hypothetical protein
LGFGGLGFYLGFSIFMPLKKQAKRRLRARETALLERKSGSENILMIAPNHARFSGQGLMILWHHASADSIEENERSILRAIFRTADGTFKNIANTVTANRAVLRTSNGAFVARAEVVTAL